MNDFSEPKTQTTEKKPAEFSFEIHNKVEHEFDAECVEEAKKAALAVWKKHFPDTSTSFNIQFYQRIIATDGSLDARSAGYYPPEDRISLGADNMKDPGDFMHKLFEKDRRLVVFLTVAHETMHKVQLARGDTLVPVGPKARDQAIFEEILQAVDRPWEHEAWVEAFEALSTVYPNLMVGMNLLGSDGVKTYKTRALEEAQKAYSEGNNLLLKKRDKNAMA